MPKASEELIQISARRQVHLERLKSGDFLSYQKFLTIMRDDVRHFLATELNVKRIQTLNRRLKELNGALKSTQSDYKKVWLEQIKAVGKEEASFQRIAMQNVTDLSFTLPAPAQLQAAIFNTPMQLPGIDGGLLIDQYFDKVSQKSIDLLNSQIRVGFAQGESIGEITSRIIQTSKRALDGEVFKAFRRNAETLVRTTHSHASTQARQSLFEANDIKRVQWSATLDGRTSAICRSLDGQIFPIDEGPRPPLHPNERSSMVPVFDEKFSFLRDGAERISKGDAGLQRVDAKLSYYEWLKTQNIDFQNSAIGTKRALLLRNGGLSADRFAELQLNKSFEPITLEEMRGLAPVAFKKAGI
jgi:SPP1 gp7 family putative phage head morphogenesis protein